MNGAYDIFSDVHMHWRILHFCCLFIRHSAGTDLPCLLYAMDGRHARKRDGGLLFRSGTLFDWRRNTPRNSPETARETAIAVRLVLQNSAS